MLNLNLQNQISLQLKQALNPARSQRLGRRIYQVSLDAQLYWVKIQLPHMSPQHELSFQRELSHYQCMIKQCPELIPPFHILDLRHPQGAGQDGLTAALMIRDTQAWFAIPPDTLDRSAIIEVLLQSLEMLEKLHGLGYIHGDLKAEHFRRFQEQAVFIDFEQMVDLTDQVQSNNTATPHYMAPELFHAEAKSLASDIYALGIIWLEWLNQCKFQEKTYLDWAKLHCQQLEIDLKSEYKAFEQVLSAILHRQKSKRCTNFYQIKQLLSDIV